MANADDNSPGRLLADELEARGWDTIEIAQRSALPLDMIHDIIRGDQAVTDTISIRLSRAFGTTPMFWLDVQRRYNDERTD